MLRRRVEGQESSAHILTDTMGMLVAGMVHAAGIKHRDGAVPLLAQRPLPFPWPRCVFAGGGYAGEIERRWANYAAGR